MAKSMVNRIRQAMHFLQYRTELKRAGVRIVSITQNAGDDPAGELDVDARPVRRIYFERDRQAYPARHAAKCPARVLERPVAAPRFSQLRSREAEKQVQAQVQINDEEAFVVGKIFELYLAGPAGSGPLGITRLAS